MLSWTWLPTYLPAINKPKCADCLFESILAHCFFTAKKVDFLKHVRTTLNLLIICFLSCLSLYYLVQQTCNVLYKIIHSPSGATFINTCFILLSLFHIFFPLTSFLYWHCLSLYSCSIAHRFLVGSVWETAGRYFFPSYLWLCHLLTALEVWRRWLILLYWLLNWCSAGERRSKHTDELAEDKAEENWINSLQVRERLLQKEKELFVLSVRVNR